MRFGLAATLAILFVAGCAPQPQDRATADRAAQPPAANYDYRYAFRLPGDRIAALQESHARGCEALGPARCRITALKYGVDDSNRASAVLALTLDPAIARGFGKAATDAALRARGALVSSEIRDDPAAGSVPARLRRAAQDAEAKRAAATDPEERAALASDASRARTAMATIADLDRANGPLLATAPVLLTYTAGSGAAAGGASFEAAGDTLAASLAGLVTLLAGVGPWLLLLVGGALLLRRLIGPDASRPPAPAEPERPNAVQRWFGGATREREDA